MMNRRGFTLMEVLISIALLLVLSSVIFAFLRDVLASRDRVIEITAKQRLTSAIIERIEQQAIFSLVGDETFGSGIIGDETSLTILSRGVAAHETAHADSWPYAFHDLIRTEYRFDENSHAVQVRQEVPKLNAGTENSARTAGRMHDEDQNTEPEYETFDTRLYMVRFRYHDGSVWRGQYDARDAGRLPTAIEIAVWFDPWPGSEWNDEDSDPFATFGNEDELERLTFDMEGVFDEMDYATRADRDFRPDPPPDRIRVIAIPDAEEDEFDTPQEVP